MRITHRIALIVSMPIALFIVSCSNSDLSRSTAAKEIEEHLSANPQSQQIQLGQVAFGKSTWCSNPYGSFTVLCQDMGKYQQLAERGLIRLGESLHHSGTIFRQVELTEKASPYIIKKFERKGNIGPLDISYKRRRIL